MKVHEENVLHVGVVNGAADIRESGSGGEDSGNVHVNGLGRVMHNMMEVFAGLEATGHRRAAKVRTNSRKTLESGRLVLNEMMQVIINGIVEEVEDGGVKTGHVFGDFCWQSVQSEVGGTSANEEHPGMLGPGSIIVFSELGSVQICPSNISFNFGGHGEGGKAG